MSNTDIFKEIQITVFVYFVLYILQVAPGVDVEIISWTHTFNIFALKIITRCVTIGNVQYYFSANL
jgi:hypothetical protein